MWFFRKSQEVGILGKGLPVGSEVKGMEAELMVEKGDVPKPGDPAI